MFKPIIAILLFLFAHVAARCHDENVIIKRLDERYSFLTSATGTIERIRKNRTVTYLAQRADDKTFALEQYDSSMKINKASAPGSKPLYVANEYGDMFYTGQHICALPIELTKGKEATARFEVMYDDPTQFCEIFLAESKPVELATYTVTVPEFLDSCIKITPLDVPDGVSLERTEGKNGDITYSVTLQNRPPYRTEPHSPKPNAFVPRIVVSGLFPSHHDLYTYLHGRVEDEEPNTEIVELTNSITAQCSNHPVERANAIADWVRQNIRYIAIEHDEYGTKPDLAANVLSKRFGDCKGSANLICKMLRAAGMDGRLVWVGTRGDVVGKFEDYPVLGAGNHMIACAVLPDTIIYLDGTTKFCPAGYLPRAIAGTQVMIENGDSCMLRNIPEYDHTEDYIMVKGDFTLTDTDLKGVINLNLSGHERLIFENTNAGISTARRGVFYNKYLSPTKTARLDSIEIANVPTNAKLTPICFQEVDGGAVISLSSKRYVTLRPWRLLRIDPVDLSDRHTPISYESYQHIISDMTLHIPEGWQIGSLPEPTTIENDWFEGNLQFVYNETDNTVQVTGKIRCKNNEAPSTRMSEFNGCLRQIDKINKSAITLQKN